MARGAREADLRIRGMGLMARFALSMTIALTVVMVIAGYALYRTATGLIEEAVERQIGRAMVLTHDAPEWEQVGKTARERMGGAIRIFPVKYGDELQHRGTVFRQFEVRKDRFREEFKPLQTWLVPDEVAGRDAALLRVVAAVLIVVVLVGAAVSLWIAQRVAQPLGDIVGDIRQISKGDLHHRSRARGGGEIELLARTIDRMAHELEEARDVEVELSIRQREMDLAAGVHEALLPLATPLIEGYDLGAAHLASAHFGGDFHDFIELGDGRVGLLVCDVSGEGIPAALIGATARSYLRSALSSGGDVAELLKGVNQELVRDVRRGMFVTALYVLVDPSTDRAQVACAGHKVPLVRYCAADEKLRLVHPEGIALGFDRGPVFDRTLRVQEIELAPGDRLFLTNASAVGLTDPDGEELGERSFYQAVLRHVKQPTPRFLRGVRQVLSDFVGDEGFSVGISLVTVSREA